MRKEKEDSSIAELRFMIQKAEHALTAEVKRRVDATLLIETKTKRMVDDVEQRLALRLQDQTDAMNGRMKELEERLDALEATVENDAKTYKASIQKRGTELKLQLHELTRDLEQEKKSRLVREGRFLQQMESHAKDLDDRWRKEQEERIAEIGHLTTLLETQEQQRSSQQRAWQHQVTTELAALHKELAAEVKERQAEDEAVVAALHAYTQQLQHSLSILNGEQ